MPAPDATTRPNHEAAAARSAVQAPSPSPDTIPTSATGTAGFDVTVVEVPQWRGSGAPTAERLREGAKLLADMVPATHRVRVEVDDHELPETAARVRSAVSAASASGGFVVTAGGDCGVELEPVAEALRRHGDRLVVVWFDAHGDLNTPATSPSGAFHGMVLRALTGEGPAGLVADEPLDPRRIVLAAVRDLDPGETAFIQATGIQQITGPDPAALTEAITSATPDIVSSLADHASPVPGIVSPFADHASGVPGGTSAPPAPNSPSPDHASATPTSTHPSPDHASPSSDRTSPPPGRASAVPGRGSRGQGPAVYIHIDLDVLDPRIFTSVGSPAPGGLEPDQLLAMVKAAADRFEIVGLGITEYEPSRPEDQALLTPLVQRLVEACTSRRT
ncbi:arginase family protein [Nonomuraea sp. NPDC050691]|uniref:arginase family protein n=1 Tax=Nonomuraea sp. NPDC050691 TaxID=3155661 RepID=UPI0033D86605